MLQVCALQPITVVITNDTLSICRHDGLTYTGPTLNADPNPLVLLSETALATTSDWITGSVDGPSAAEPIPVLDSAGPTFDPPVPVLDSPGPSATSPTTVLDTLGSLSPRSPNSPDIDPLDETLVDRLTRKLNAATPVVVPPVARPIGKIRQRVKSYILRIAENHNRVHRNPSLQLHIMYRIGMLLHTEGREVRRCLPSILTAQRTRERVLQSARRMYQLVSRIGLGRVYAVPSFTLAQLQSLTTAEFDQLLDNLQVEVTGGSDRDSESLIFEGGADVTPGCPGA